MRWKIKTDKQMRQKQWGKIVKKETLKVSNREEKMKGEEKEIFKTNEKGGGGLKRKWKKLEKEKRKKGSKWTDKGITEELNEHMNTYIQT